MVKYEIVRSRWKRERERGERAGCSRTRSSFKENHRASQSMNNDAMNENYMQKHDTNMHCAGNNIYSNQQANRTHTPQWMAFLRSSTFFSPIPTKCHFIWFYLEHPWFNSATSKNWMETHDSIIKWKKWKYRNRKAIPRSDWSLQVSIEAIQNIKTRWNW